ncbi:MAG: YdcF family protein [Deltaproteobacteria bacterium]|nr:YdcF family protein [Deltaproteobacteria bacterium]
MMITNEDIICFSSIDWDFNWQGHQEIMHRLAAGGNRVLFIENTGVRRPRLSDYPRLVKRIRNWRRGYKGFRLQEKNLYVFSPLLLPFPHSRLARWLNRMLFLRLLKSWCRAQRYSSPIVWSFLPSALTLEVIKSLPYKLLIYYCIDSFEHSSAGASRIKASEKRMIRLADLVFVTSELLREHCLVENEEVHKFPFTVDYETFEKVRESPGECLPEDLQTVAPPRIGYIGGLHRWIDQELVSRLCELLPEVNFVFVGPEQEQMALLHGLPNAYLLGGKDHDLLPCYLRYFELGLIPYRKTDYTDNVYPTKLNEYLAMGLPVVSTPIREVALFAEQHPSMVDLGENAETLAGHIRNRLAAAGGKAERGLRRARIELARKNSWSVRMEKMSELIRNKINTLKTGVDLGWRERLASVYSTYRKRTLAVIAGVFLLYATVYWTPFIYFLGGPLRVEETPACSDVILVFGGGVGEKGKPGTSTVERARFAARLYRAGLAPRVVFSSGYQQFNRRDSEDMQKFALAEGVDPEAIIIENKAANNYQNVTNCLALMAEGGFSSAVVVSGQYNMLRTKLLFDRQLALYPESRITQDSLYLTPVDESIFFHPRAGSRLEQLKAILHEYAAIVYYWWLDRI